MKQMLDTWREDLGDDDAARRLWAAVGEADGSPAQDVDVDAGWARLRVALGEASPIPRDAPPLPQAKVVRLVPRRRRRYLRAGLAAAAAVALLAVVNLLAGLGDTAVAFANATAADMPVRLPDDSEAMLTPGSQLQYVERDGRREVTMAGAVAFDVRARGDMSFAVSAQELEIVVMGTSFVVNDAGVAGVDAAGVDVAEGHVRVRGRREADWTDVFAGGYARVRDGLVADARASAGPGVELAFRDATAAEVLDALTEAHGVSFAADAGLRACRLTVNLEETTPGQAAVTLAAVLGAEVVERAGGYYLRGGSCG